MSDVLTPEEVWDAVEPWAMDEREAADRLRELAGSHEALRAERDDARRFAEDAAQRYNELLATAAENTAVTCAYCGVVYPAGTPRHGDGVLAEHIRTCPQHPMREAEAQPAQVRELPDRWDCEVADYPTSTDDRAMYAAKAVQMCAQELRDALAPASTQEDQ